MLVSFEDLNSLESSAPRADTRIEYACVWCNGTGFYQGARVHEERSECFVCKGAGKVHLSPADQRAKRSKNRAAAAKRAETIRENAIKSAGDHYEFLLSAATWSDTGRSFLEQINAGRRLSEKQAATLASMHAKSDATKAARKAEKEAGLKVVDLSPISNMFSAAFSSGLKTPKYRAAGVVLSAAKPCGANPGAIYVKDEGGEYMGKVVDGKFHPSYACDKVTIGTALDEIAANPGEAAKLHGIKTGTCSCCGRELTDPASIAAGIGPVCATSWGF